MAEFGAHQISKLLAERHKDDVWVPECKNGPTHDTRQLRILDGWAMRKSWAHFSTIGYEIKVSRSDFGQDQKWVEYLPYCHEFYFVCPAGLIKAGDLPRGIGLIWMSVNGARLVTKTKSEKREPEADKLRELMVYVLMCRAKTHDEPSTGRPDMDKSWREVVEQAEKRKGLAHFVNQHVRAAFDREQQENERLRGEVEKANSLRTFLEEAGVPWPETHWSAWETKRALNERIGRVPNDVLDGMRGVRNTLDRWLGTLDRKESV